MQHPLSRGVWGHLERASEERSRERLSNVLQPFCTARAAQVRARRRRAGNGVARPAAADAAVVGGATQGCFNDTFQL